MTAVSPQATRQAAVEAALLVLERMGLSPADLAVEPDRRALGRPAPGRADTVGDPGSDGVRQDPRGGPPQRPRFPQLQQRMHVTSAAQATRLSSHIPISYVFFDVLHAGGRPLLDVPYWRRHELLDGLSLGPGGGHWQIPPPFAGHAGADILSVSRDHGPRRHHG